MNASVYSIFGEPYKYDEVLFNDMIHYGTILGEAEVETYNLDMVRVRVFNLCGKIYWVKQFNGNVVELREIS